MSSARETTLARLRAAALLVAFAGAWVFALAGLRWLPFSMSASVAVGIFGLTAIRLARRVRSTALGPRWLVRFDETLVVHWVAGGLAVLPVTFAHLLLPHTAPTIALGAYLVALVPAAWSVWGERFRLEVTEHEIHVAGLPSALDGLRCVQLSDLHIGPFTDLALVRRWQQAVVTASPELVAITGDFVASASDECERVAGLVGALVTELARNAPHSAPLVVAVLGNHDQAHPERLTGCLERAGVRVLGDEHCALRVRGETLLIAGVGAANGRRGNVAPALAGSLVPPTLLLSHYPDVFAAAALADVPLCLAGHSHGGQAAVPFFSTKRSGSHRGRTARGLHTAGRSTLYVHRGLGTTGLPLRFGSRPEVAVLVLRANAFECRLPS